MRIGRFLLTAVITASAFTAMAAPQADKDKMDQFIDNLMGKMTLQEKIGQLNLPVSGEIVTGQAKSSDVAGKIRKGQVGGLFNVKGVENIREVQKIAVEQSRLKIPLLFGMDVIHGYETVFPIPLALSCSWDMEAIKESARIAAKESSADGICWTFSPMVDICRDPRWGRMAEGGGEDPYLGSEISAAMVKGYQGDDLTDKNTIMACVKHFALYGAPEAGRDYNTVDMSHLSMFNNYFPPYKAAIDVGVGSVMTSFNVVDGIPATGNKWLMTDVLRDRWGFDGFVVTDYTAISEMIAHGMGDLHVLFQQSKGCILRFCVVILVQPADDLHLTALFDVKIILVDVVDEVIDHAFLIHHRDVQQHFGVVAGLLEECGKDLVQSVALLDEEQPEQLVQRIVGFQPQDGLLLIRGEVQLGIKGGRDQIRLHLAALRGENADVGG